MSETATTSGNTMAEMPAGEKSILWIESDTTANNTSVRCRFSGKLVRDSDG